MTMNRDTCLYVMQAPSGRIKIGHSKDPVRRRGELEHQCGVRLKILATLPGRGKDEYEIQGEMWEYHCKIGEWYYGSPECQKALSEALGMEVVFPRFERPRKYKRKAKPPRPTYPPIPPNQNSLSPHFKGRVVRRRMADGTAKEYRYPPYSAGNKKTYKENSVTEVAVCDTDFSRDFS